VQQFGGAPGPGGEHDLIGAPGTDLVYSPYGVHHNPKLYSDPARFDPDRWLPDRARALPDCAYLPFGAGPRKCIGDRLSMTQMLVVLARIAARFRFEAAPGHRVRPNARVFLMPGAMSMTCQPRS